MLLISSVAFSRALKIARLDFALPNPDIKYEDTPKASSVIIFISCERDWLRKFVTIGSMHLVYWRPSCVSICLLLAKRLRKAMRQGLDREWTEKQQQVVYTSILHQYRYNTCNTESYHG